MRAFRPVALCAGLLLSITTLSAAAQSPRLYKWVDEQGNVHYSDRNEAAGAVGTAQRINAHGMRIGSAHSALPQTPEEHRQYEQARRLAQHDTMLLSTYGSELDLLRAHDESRTNLEGTIKTAEGNIVRLQREIADRQSRSGHYAEELRHLEVQVAAERERLSQLLTRRLQLHERQNEEVARYRELTTRNG